MKPLIVVGPVCFAIMRPVGQPLCVSGFRVAAIAGSRLLDSLEGECDLHPVDEHASREWLQAVRPDLVLIESDGLRSERDSSGWGHEEAGELLEACRESGIPSGVWVSEGDGAGMPRSTLLRRADRVFAPDTVSADLLADQVPRRPIVVPHAASRSALRGSLPDGAGAAYVDGYDGRPPDGSEAYVDSLFEAAGPLGMRILASRDSDRAAELLRECGALPYFGPAESLPRAVFDALGAGLHVVAPGNHVALRVVPGLVAHSSAAAKVGVELRSAMGATDEELSRRASRRAVIAHAHTYPHRLATIASAFGFALLPDGEARRPD